MIHLSSWMHLTALTLTHHHKPLLSVQSKTKFSLLTVSSDPWTNKKKKLAHTCRDIHSSLPPVAFSHYENLVKPCPSLHAERRITMQLSPQRVKNQPNPAWNYTLLLNHPHPPPLPSCCSFISYIFDSRPLSLFVLLDPPLLGSVLKKPGEEKTGGLTLWEWQNAMWGAVQTCRRLIRHPYWQGSVGQIGKEDQ